MPLPGSKTWRTSALSALCLSALVLAQPGCVQGVVSGPIEKPLVGATVTVIDANDRSLTNTDGRYDLPNISADKAIVVVTSGGCLSLMFFVTVREEDITAKVSALRANETQPVSVVKPLPIQKSAVIISRVITEGRRPPPTVTAHGPIENSLQMTAKSDKVSYQLCESIRMLISVKNVSGKDVYLEDDGGDLEVTVIRYDVEMPVTEFGAESRENWISLQKQRFRGGGPPHQISGPIPPGQARDHHFSVNLFQDMMLDSLYTIAAKRKPTGSTRLGTDPIQMAVLYSGGGIY